MLDRLPKDIQNKIANSYLKPTDVHNLRLVSKHFSTLKLKPDDRIKIIIEKIIHTTIEAIKEYIPICELQLKIDNFSGQNSEEEKKEGYASNFLDILSDDYLSNDFKFFVIHYCILDNQSIDTKLKKFIQAKYTNKIISEWEELLKHANANLAYTEEQKLEIADAIKRHVSSENNQNSGQRRFITYYGRDSQLICNTRALFMLNDKELFSHKVIPQCLNKITEYLAVIAPNLDEKQKIERFQTILQDETISPTIKATLVYGMCFRNKSLTKFKFFEALWNNLRKILRDKENFEYQLENRWMANIAEEKSIEMQKLFNDDNKTIEELKSGLLELENNWNKERNSLHKEMNRGPKIQFNNPNTNPQNRHHDPQPGSKCLVM